jgi:hypothetical protein
MTLFVSFRRGNIMRPHFSVLLFAAVLACLPAGCGTMWNLTSPPPSKATEVNVFTTCQPFGGVSRSFIFGMLCMGGVVNPSFDKLGEGELFMRAIAVAAGTVIFAVETPLSLAGDVMTLPIVCARQQELHWATWWGEQGGKIIPATEARDPTETPATQATDQTTAGTVPAVMKTEPLEK